MRCSLPLAGREEPQIDIEDAIQEQGRAEQSHSSSPVWVGPEIDKRLHPKVRRQNRRPSLQHAKGELQSVTAVNFETRSPTPECQRTSGAFKQTAVSRTTPAWLKELFGAGLLS